MQQIGYKIETALAVIVFTFFWLIRVNVASFTGGMIARILGPLHKSHTIAKRNIAFVFPSLSKKEQHKILSRMWWNLGRNIGEFVHIRTLAKKTKTVGLEYAKDALTHKGQVIIVSGHFANWELGLLSLSNTGVPIAGPYRPANNPHFDTLMKYIRGDDVTIFPKGKEAAIGLLRHLKKGGNIGMLMDQKMNEGPLVPFFNYPVRTQTLMAELAIKHNLPIVPSRIVRNNGADFTQHYHKPIWPDKTKTADILLQEIHTTLENWIKETPEQWFWVHNRWPKERDIKD